MRTVLTPFESVIALVGVVIIFLLNLVGKTSLVYFVVVAILALMLALVSALKQATNKPVTNWTSLSIGAAFSITIYRMLRDFYFGIYPIETLSENSLIFSQVGLSIIGILFFGLGLFRIEKTHVAVMTLAGSRIKMLYNEGWNWSFPFLGLLHGPDSEQVSYEVLELDLTEEYFANKLKYRIVVRGLLVYRVSDAYLFLETGEGIQDLASKEIKKTISSILDKYTDLEALPNSERLTQMLMKAIAEGALPDADYGKNGVYEKDSGGKLKYDPKVFTYPFKEWGITINAPMIDNVAPASKEVEKAAERIAIENLEQSSEVTDAQTLNKAIREMMKEADERGTPISYDKAADYLLANRGKLSYQKFDISGLKQVVEAFLSKKS